jgi:hypothetical protein
MPSVLEMLTLVDKICFKNEDYIVFLFLESERDKMFAQSWSHFRSFFSHYSFPNDDLAKQSISDNQLPYKVEHMHVMVFPISPLVSTFYTVISNTQSKFATIWLKTVPENNHSNGKCNELQINSLFKFLFVQWASLPSFDVHQAFGQNLT